MIRSLLLREFQKREPTQASARQSFWQARARNAEHDLDTTASRAVMRAVLSVLARGTVGRDRNIRRNSADPLMRSTLLAARPCDVLSFAGSHEFPARRDCDDFNATRTIQVRPICISDASDFWCGR